jgi:hypothetical protein
MKAILIQIFFLFISLQAFSQNSDCYKRLYQRGNEEFEKGNWAQAILKWHSAKENCPEITTNEKKILEGLIKKASDKLVNTSTASSIKSNEGIKNVKTETIYITKHDTIYITKFVEKKVFIDRPIEKIVYKDKPEPFHQYGKGNCKIIVFTSCPTGGTTKVWIDGSLAGSFNVYLPSGQPSCDDTNFVSKITLAGIHHIQTKNDKNATTDFYITLDEDQCNVQGISCEQKDSR